MLKSLQFFNQRYSGLKKNSCKSLKNDNFSSASSIANVHSIESFSAVDGPGVRFVVFLQGCNLRCKVCSNPDTWNFVGGTTMSAKDIADKIKSVKNYYGKDGGVTVSGGEALLNPYFVSDLFQRVHDIGLTTCLDTAGQASEHNINLVLPHTDYTMFCIKHMDPLKYYIFTGQDQTKAMKFWDKLEENKNKYVIRYVLVPGITDDSIDIIKLCEKIKQCTYCDGIELLPYHTLGKYKWEMMGLKYAVDSNPPTSEEIDKTIKLIKSFDIGINI